MLPFKNFAEEIARKAGGLLKEKLSQKHEIYYKGEINLITEMDKMSEDLIVTAISRNYPDHGILSEESPAIAGAGKIRWIIDPLDGTTNYAHGYPVFCVSVALEDDGVVILGVIYDPMRNEMFVSARGEGAYLNGNKLQVSTTVDLS